MKKYNDSLFAFIIIEIACLLAAAFLNFVSSICGIDSNVNLYIVLPAFGFVVSVFYPIVLFLLYLKIKYDSKNEIVKSNLTFEDENGNRFTAAKSLDKGIVLFVLKNGVINEVSLTYLQKNDLINWLKR